MSLESVEGSDVRKIEQFIKIGQIVTAPLIALCLLLGIFSALKEALEYGGLLDGFMYIIIIPVLFLGLLSLLFFILSYARKYSAKTRAVMIVLAALPAGWVIGMTAIAIVLISMGLV